MKYIEINSIILGYTHIRTHFLAIVKHLYALNKSNIKYRLVTVSEIRLYKSYLIYWYYRHVISTKVVTNEKI